MTLLLTLPILIPFLAAVAALMAWRRRALQRAFGVAGSIGLLFAAAGLFESVRRHGIQSVQIGNWPAPFGITLVADLFSAVMVVVAGVVGITVIFYSLGSIDPERESFGYHPLVQILLMGVCGAFLTGDIFNLYVWFEVLLMASFVLLALGGERAQMEGAIKYVTLNLLSSAFFLAAIGILYGVAGTLNMADLSRKLAGLPSPGLATTLAMLFLVAFGIKAAIFPLFFWLPASYHVPPVAVTALFSGLLTKVGVYALVRVFTLLFVQDIGYTHTLLLVIAGLTMVTGVLGAVAQMEFRRLLSFHIVSQIGYLLMGLGIFTPLALAGTVFFMVHVIFSKAALFLVSGVADRLAGTTDLKKLGGLYRAAPGLSVLFLIPALSLAGLPPLSGFFAKLTLVQAGLGSARYPIVAVALGVSVLTLFSMIKIWTEAFWKDPPASDERKGPGAAGAPSSQPLLFIPILALAILIVLLGLGAEPLMNIALRAAEQLLNPSEYIRSVLGGER
jgi:multicomponent Na+:H+ antiporter subunit D